MIGKPKQCAGCGDLKTIWKNYLGQKYCKDCWYKKEPIKAPKPKSNKKDVLDGLYSKLRKDFLIANPYCKARLQGCSANATDIHHTKGRGVFYLDKTTWLSVCRSCHNWIELNPLKAKDLEFSKTRLENENK
jgi:hypothetical protein